MVLQRRGGQALFFGYEDLAMLCCPGSDKKVDHSVQFNGGEA